MTAALYRPPVKSQTEEVRGRQYNTEVLAKFTILRQRGVFILTLKFKVLSICLGAFKDCGRGLNRLLNPPNAPYE